MAKRRKRAYGIKGFLIALVIALVFYASFTPYVPIILVAGKHINYGK